MLQKLRRFMIGLAVSLQVIGPLAMAADTSIGTLSLSGNVPVVFSLTVRGLPGDLDLTPGVVVNDRLLGILHFKYNVDIASLAITSSTASGTPENAVGAYAFGVAFKYKFLACATIVAANEALFTIAGAGAAMADPATTAGLTNGREEDCSLTASWGGTAASLPLAGKYSEVLTFTMVSI